MKIETKMVQKFQVGQRVTVNRHADGHKGDKLDNKSVGLVKTITPSSDPSVEHRYDVEFEGHEGTFSLIESHLRAASDAEVPSVSK